MPYPFKNEKTGYVIFNFETARQMIKQLEADNRFRIDILTLAEECMKQVTL
ncbi:30S ribosomal protein S6 [Heyndrickxia camelliae]|uniref:30S ribosomal protein S6 n=1 Tax=Heyndrickxia camelliae TaxID=1707093 RepID=UPI001F3A2D63|nr:30S ribosomal protein S6 [Heyndrickxia camelliae]